MSVSRSRATNLHRAERKTLFAFLFLYSIFSIIILAFLAFIYYNLQKDLMLEGQTNRLQEDSFLLISKLKYLHEHFEEEQVYPRFENFRSAIYDSSKKLIFTTLKEESVNLDKTLYSVNDNIHYIRLLESYYLGTMYVVIEISDDGVWLNFVKTEVIAYGTILFLIFLFVGYYLLKLMLRPMRNTLSFLDRFIKDTTHELNTPVTAILTNIEMIDQKKLDPIVAKKIRRIDIASRTISNIYKDLTFTALGNKVISKDESIDLYKLLSERIEYFKIIALSKNIEFITSLKQNVFLYIDRIKMTRVIDNLLSNAIKYNKKAGYIKVTLEDGYIEIEDGGIGISQKDIDAVFDRFSRFNSSEGGFGLGLNIVKSILDEYGIKIKFISKVNKGTKVRVYWEKL